MKLMERAVDNYLLPLAQMMATQRYLVAIRDAFIALMPFVIIASFCVLLNSVVLDAKSGLVSMTPLAQYTDFWNSTKDIGVIVYNGTLNILSLLVTFGVAYKLAHSYGEDGLISGLLGVSLLVMLFPATLTVTSQAGEVIKLSGWMNADFTSATGLFVGILVSIVGTELFLRFSKLECLKIKMPESVPFNVAKSFNILLPVICVMFSVSLFGLIVVKCFGVTVHEIIIRFIQAPLLGIMQGWSGITAILFLQNLLWSFGLHGAFILMPITEPTLLVAIQQNLNAMVMGNMPPNIVTKPFLDAFGFMGGGGATLGLLFAIFLASKREDYRTIAKLGTIPSFFNINEPLIFGLPVIFNPILGIPLVLVPMVTTSIAYFVTYMGWVNRTTVLLPWTTPPVISAFLSTNGDYRAVILSLLTIGVSTLIYLPFVIAENKAVQRINE